MKLLSFIIAAAVCVAVVPLLSAEAESETEVFTTVTTDRSVYNSTEPIDITVAVTNAGSEVITIPFPSSLQQYYCVNGLDSGNVVYDLKYHVIVWWWLTNITLEPGQTDSLTIYSTSGKDSWCRASSDGDPVRKPGYYVINGMLNVMSHLSYDIGQKVIVISDNKTSPSAAITFSKNIAAVGDSVLFDASMSENVVSQNNLLEYRWDWNTDGTYDTNWTNESSAEHSFTEAGEYIVTVQVRDPAGLVSEATTTVYVDVAVPEFRAASIMVVVLALFVLAAYRRKLR